MRLAQRVWLLTLSVLILGLGIGILVFQASTASTPPPLGLPSASIVYLAPAALFIHG